VPGPSAAQCRREPSLAACRQASRSLPGSSDGMRLSVSGLSRSGLSSAVPGPSSIRSSPNSTRRRKSLRRPRDLFRRVCPSKAVQRVVALSLSRPMRSFARLTSELSRSCPSRPAPRGASSPEPRGRLLVRRPRVRRGLFAGAECRAARGRSFPDSGADLAVAHRGALSSRRRRAAQRVAQRRARSSGDAAGRALASISRVGHMSDLSKRPLTGHPVVACRTPTASLLCAPAVPERTALVAQRGSTSGTTLTALWRSESSSGRVGGRRPQLRTHHRRPGGPWARPAPVVSAAR